MTEVAVKKISVALDAKVAEEAVRCAEAAGMSLSAWLSAAAEEAIGIQEGLAAVAEYEAEFGEFTEEEMAWADALLNSSEQHIDLHDPRFGRL